MINLWRKNIDFSECDMFEFPTFEDVLQKSVLQSRIENNLAIFQIPSSFPPLLAENLYDYCTGKMCNLKDETRWKANFLGEISGFLLENGRYLQAYLRDVNLDIENGGSSKVTSQGEEKSGKADTRKKGSAENEQNSGVSGSNQQSGTVELGDTLTILNNQTTSTNYLAAKTDEAYSRGSTTETGSSDFVKNDKTNIRLEMENGASLMDTKDARTTETENTKSPLDIAYEESNFKFKDWFVPLYTILDCHFMSGGYDYA
jgi:hypothetical protein